MSGGMAKNSLLLTGELFDTATATIRVTQVGWLGLFHEHNVGWNVGRDLLHPKKRAHSVQGAPRGHPVNSS